MLNGTKWSEASYIFEILPPMIIGIRMTNLEFYDFLVSFIATDLFVPFRGNANNQK